MHLLTPSPQSCVLILRDVVLNLEVSIHVLEVFALLLFENWSLVCLAYILGAIITNLLGSFILDVIGHWVSVSTAEEDVARAIVMDNLLDHLSLIVVVLGWCRLGCHSLHAKHWLDWDLILEVRWSSAWDRSIEAMW